MKFYSYEELEKLIYLAETDEDFLFAWNAMMISANDQRSEFRAAGENVLKKMARHPLWHSFVANITTMCTGLPREQMFKVQANVETRLIEKGLMNEKDSG